MAEIKEYTVVGIMSGTSLDGIDFALCCFNKVNNNWKYQITKAQTIKYPDSWLQNLQNAENLSGRELLKLHAAYGTFIGLMTKQFCSGQQVDTIASHGHTIFHEPQQGMTFQLGLGANIAAEAGINVISDFRTKDVALGGNGAPLVPIGDDLLFAEYDLCLNLGGFANVSFASEEGRQAFDICPVNMLLNRLSNKVGLAYDDQGKLAQSGKVIDTLLDSLNELSYYQQSGAKSLGKEWFDSQVWPLVNTLPVADALATSVKHIAMQIANSVKFGSGKMLCTGGGVFNNYLMQQIKQACTNIQVVIPGKEIIEFKEAMLFAFLGALFLNQENNVLSKATGSIKNHIGGCLNYG